MCVSSAYLYFACLKWAVSLVVGTGYMHPNHGPFPSHYSQTNEWQTKFTIAEDILVHVLKLFGIMFWALQFSNLVSAVTRGDPEKNYFNAEFDALNRLCREYDVPTPLARELRRYLHEKEQVQRYQLRNSFCVEKLSPELLRKVSPHG